MAWAALGWLSGAGSAGPTVLSGLISGQGAG